MSERTEGILEFFILVDYLDTMLICRLIAAVAANGGKMAIGRHGVRTPSESYPDSQEQFLRQGIVVLESKRAPTSGRVSLGVTSMRKRS
jgi:hypothetical protein